VNWLWRRSVNGAKFSPRTAENPWLRESLAVQEIVITENAGLFTPPLRFDVDIFFSEVGVDNQILLMMSFLMRDPSPN
jgi:hypothetical protein